MAKKVWLSLPLVTTADLKDESVVSFLKGGSKKDLELEVAAFITKWLMDRDVPFGIDFESCGVDRALVIESLPKRLQKILGSAAVAVESGEVAPTEDTPEVGGAEAVEHVAEVGAAEAADPDEGLSGDDGVTDGPSEPC